MKHKFPPLNFLCYFTANGWNKTGALNCRNILGCKKGLQAAGSPDASKPVILKPENISYKFLKLPEIMKTILLQNPRLTS
jgi:hypothetical protein